MHKIGLIMAGNTFVKCFEKWHFQLTQDRRTLKVMQRMLMLSAWKALRTWEENHFMIQHNRLVCQKLINNWLNQTVMNAFHSWVDNHKHNLRMKHVMKQIIQRMHGSALTNCFLAWQYTTTDEGRMERRLGDQLQGAG